MGEQPSAPTPEALKDKVDAIRARHAAATRGPWKWFGYANRSRKTGGFYLATAHGGRRYIMDFVRSGFRDAQPRFQPEPHRGMLLASELAEYEVEYRNDITRIAAPDAVFIEHSWQDVSDLLARITELEAQFAKRET